MTRSGGVPIRVTHVIAGLQLGGAEMMLYKLLRARDRERFDASVISLSTLGALSERIAALGVPVSAIGMTPGRLQARPLGRLARYLAARRPHVVQTWMYHADLLGGTLARLQGEARVIWGVRGSLDPRLSKRSSRLTARACASLSRRVPDRIVSCSHRLAQMHVELGYDAARMLVIPNGFDLEWLTRDPTLREQTRTALGLGDGAAPGACGEEAPSSREATPLVGIVGRYDPQKDYRSFARAAGEIARTRADARFVLCGPGVTTDNRELVGWLCEAGIYGSCELLGAVGDPRGIFNALDVLVCSSAFGEGFPNVIGEAMACGVPCVSTDVGDAARIVADSGRIVRVGDWRALAGEVLAVLALAPEERSALGDRARARIVQEYELGAVARRFEALYQELSAPALSARRRRCDVRA